MVTAVVALAFAIAGAIGGVVYFGRAALVRADRVTKNAETARAALDAVEEQLEEAEAGRVAAETTIERMKAANDDSADDPILEKWFGEALDLLHPAARQLVVDGLAADRLHQDGDGDADDPGGGPVRVPEGPGSALITELG